MKIKIFGKISILFFMVLFFSFHSLYGKEKEKLSKSDQINDVESFKTFLIKLSEGADNELFALHFKSIVDVIEAKGNLNTTDLAFLKATFPVFSDPSAAGSPTEISSYLNRSRQLTIAWVSPTDGEVSLSHLRLPKDWDPDKSYPLYIELHGFWGVADNMINFMTNTYRSDPSSSTQFEDGYKWSPWGRGNLWYEGISETDIWEGIEKIESILKIDLSRKYLTGHSMGGYGAWRIASKSPDVWAAIGIHAGALWYGNDMLSAQNIENLSKMPAYFVVGDIDGLYDINLSAYNLLLDAGNQNIKFVTFPGGHEYISTNVGNMYEWIKNFKNEKYSGFLESIEEGKNNILFCPNQVRTETTININLAKKNLVQLNLFNNKGENVAVILNESLEKGNSTISWKRGELPSGIYSYYLSFGKNNLSGKLILY